MWMNLAWGLPYLVVTVVGALVCALAGPKGPGTAKWRVPGVLGFAMLALQHLLQTGQTLMLYRGAGRGFYFDSPAYIVLSVLGTILSLVGLLFIAAAVVRGRGPVGIFTAGAWAPPGGAYVAPDGHGPVTAPEAPAAQTAPSWSTGDDEPRKSL